jgi:hypothetical protein
MLRRFSPFVLALSLTALATPASHASSSMCVGREGCVVPPRVHQVRRPLATTFTSPMAVVVTMRSDGSQHGGIALLP